MTVPEGATPYTRAVAEVVRRIPHGEVTTYGEVATEAGFAGASRGVGRVLRTVPDLPWWRVVAANGRVAPGSAPEQCRRLRAEGVELQGQRVRMFR